MTAFLTAQAAAIFVATRFGTQRAFLLLAAPAAGVLWLVFRQRGRHDFLRALLVLSIVAAGLSAGISAIAGLDWLAEGSVARLAGTKAALSGKVLWVYKAAFGEQYAIGSLESADGNRYGGALLIDRQVLEGVGAEGLRPGDRVLVSGQVALIEGRMNPGAFDARSYWFSKGVHASLAGARLQSSRKEGAGPLRDAAWAFCVSFTSYTDSAMGDCVANPLMDAIALSDKSGLGPGVSEYFRQGGLSHVMSASGLHVSIVIAFISFVMGKAGAPGWLSLIVTSSVLPVYAVAAGLRPSIIRACITGIGSSAVRAMRLGGPDKAGLLLTAASIQLALSPMSLFDPGFQMSYLAVMGIMATGALLRGRRRRKGLAWTIAWHAQSALTGSMAISMALLPLTSSFYGQASLLSPLANVIAIPAASASLAIGLAGYLASFASKGLGLLIALPAKYLLIMLDALAGWVSRAGPFLVATGFGSGAFGLLYLAAITAAWLCLMGRLSARRLAKGAFTRLGPALPAVAALLLASMMMSAETVTIRVMSVGQGDSILVSKGGSFRMLVDTGPGFRGATAVESRILPSLRHLGVTRIDILALTHPHSDHVSGLGELAAGIDIGMTIVCEGDEETAGKARQAGLEPLFISKGGSISSGGLSIESLNGVHFADSSDDANEPSMVLMVEYLGKRAILCADAGGRFEAGYALGGASFLKVGHHGSSTSSSEAFLGKLGASYAAVSVGANIYGHPSKDVTARLAEAGAQCWRTDREGMVTAVIGRRGIYAAKESDSWDMMPFFRALKEKGGIGINPSLNVK